MICIDLTVENGYFPTSSIIPALPMCLRGPAPSSIGALGNNPMIVHSRGEEILKIENYHYGGDVLDEFAVVGLGLP